MNTKFLKSGLILLLASAAFAIIVIFGFTNQTNRKFVGNLVFEKSSAAFSDIGEIIIRTAADTVTLSVEDNLWRIKEADNYYANYGFIKELFDEINNSSFYRKQSNITENKLSKYDLNENGLSIRIFDKSGQLLNTIIVGKKTGNGLYRFAKLPDSPDVYLITGKYSFPQKLFSWIEQPLLEIAENEVAAISINNDTFERSETITPFKQSGTEKTVRVDGLLKWFNYLPALNVASVQNFDTQSYPEQKTLKITSFAGLVVNLNLYGNGKDYWINISLSSTTLPTTKISDYIKNNSFLYDGWYFKINPVVGKSIFNYSVM